MMKLKETLHCFDCWSCTNVILLVFKGVTPTTEGGVVVVVVFHLYMIMSSWRQTGGLDGQSGQF